MPRKLTEQEKQDRKQQREAMMGAIAISVYFDTLNNRIVNGEDNDNRLTEEFNSMLEEVRDELFGSGILATLVSTLSEEQKKAMRKAESYAKAVGNGR